MSKNKKAIYTIGIGLLLIGISLVLVFGKLSLFRQGDKYRLILAYEGQADYIAAVKADPAADKDALYKHYVTDVYRGSCGSNGLINLPSGVGRASAVPTHPLGSLDELAENVRILRQSDTSRIADTALQKASTLLPGSQITACIFALDPIQKGFVVMNMHGVYGESSASGSFILEVVPQGDWQDWLTYTVAHEYHHALYFRDYFRASSYSGDLTAGLILEGRADSFARIVYPERQAPWTGALTPEQEAAQWQAMQDSLTSKDPSINRRYIFGDGQIPRWTGYTIGFHIVQQYIHAHPEVSLEAWTSLDEHELLKQSGYSGQFENP